MDGLEFLGVEVQKDERTAGQKTLSFLQKVGPGLVSDVTEAVTDKKPDGTYGTPKYKPEKSWFSRPVLGPLPGGAVLVLGGGVLAGLGYTIKKLLAR